MSQFESFFLKNIYSHCIHNSNSTILRTVPSGSRVFTKNTLAHSATTIVGKYISQEERVHIVESVHILGVVEKRTTRCQEWPEGTSDSTERFRSWHEIRAAQLL